ncbi:MAG: rhodanese-like domain-containing protein [Pseudohongiellaceae bacterium]|jgi:phage shock protein E|tara:strand:+ start:36854 stop:37183 length:330 start_codon:yes stop_codon:yes gene_type:complete
MVKLSRIVFIALLSLSFSTCSLFAPQTVWIDVRTPEEYQQDHIADTPNLPHTEIATQIADLSLRKSTPIKLYCRSGVRAGLALIELEALGYTNVENVGGIADARERLAE